MKRMKGVLLILLLGLSTIVGCGPSGTFVDSQVAGLTYQTSFHNQSVTAKTTEEGVFYYKNGETLNFSIGSLVLGSALGKSMITPLDIVPGAASSSDQRVVNICVLLQTIDQDGNLNNGIRISEQISTIVSKYAGLINFNQTTAAFAADANVKTLLTELNAAGVFTDTDPRPRSLRSATAALEHFVRSTSERKIVLTKYGALKGYGPNATTWQFLGIPYAKPPLGELRWRPPHHPEPWKGVRDAIAWGDQAAQNPAYQAFGEGGMSEDCLYLNITTPRDADKLPVMVWFHGGGFSILTGNTKPFNNPASLPTKGVILVSVNHRLGPFGYIAHPWLSAESGYEGSGNYGQMDLIAALKWVQKNIAAFGGDPHNVTIFGESGGGGKVQFLMSSPLAKGLFHKGICESGMAEFSNPVLGGATLAASESRGLSLSTRLGVANLAEMRAKTWVEIMTADIGAGVDYRLYGPNIDGYFMVDTLKNTIINGLPNDVPLISGANTADMAGLVPGLQEQMPLRSQYSTANQFVYKFGKVPNGWAAKGVGAYHGIELIYVFNYPSSVVSHYLLGLTGLTPAQVGDLNGNGIMADPTDVYLSAGYGAADAAVTNNMMTMWANFAKTGDPSIPGVVNWVPYNMTSDAYIEIGTSLTVKTGLATAFP